MIDYVALGQTEAEADLLRKHDKSEELHGFFAREDCEDDENSVDWEVCGECGDTPEGLMHNNTWRNVEPLLDNE